MVKKQWPAPRWLWLALPFCLSTWAAESASAQLTVRREFQAGGQQVATLEEQLINRLRATTAQQKGFLRRVAVLVREKQLEQRLVVAVYRYSLKRHPYFPFPFFERAMRVEARKRGVDLPAVHLIAITPDLIRSQR